MNIETEIKLAIDKSLVEDIIAKIEKEFDCKKSNPFRQTTHQFFFEDYKKQNAFPRIRNEEDGNMSLTVKAKLKESSGFFKRIELEATIHNAEKVIDMMPFFGFPKKITWEKKRHSFLVNSETDVCFFSR